MDEVQSWTLNLLKIHESYCLLYLVILNLISIDQEHDLVSPVPELHGAVIACCVEIWEIDRINIFLQCLCKCLSFLDPHAVLHGISAQKYRKWTISRHQILPSKCVNIDSHFFILFDLNIFINRSRWILLVFLIEVEAHLLVDHVVLQKLHSGQDRHSHLNLLRLFIYARNISGVKQN